MEGLRFNVSVLLVLVLVVPTLGARANHRAGSLSRFEQFVTKPADDGTRWAILVAGSQGYDNYRHQADVCHAYQILKKGGLKDENIVVFMYDDIAYSSFNPRPGIIINRPGGDDVYAGVPKDYTGENVNVHNFFAVLLGDKKAVKGGSGKVVDSKAQDTVFLYYADHGGSGLLSMPNPPYLLANDLVGKLMKKHKAGGYKEMVIYIEACEAGSMFEGLLPEYVNIYATTASNAHESSFGTYCENKDNVCYGDLFSVSWMEDSETHNRKKETLGQQYGRVKVRTYANGTSDESSHVMEYGNKSMEGEKLFLYQGFDAASKEFPPNNMLKLDDEHMNTINQRDIDLLFMWHRFKKAESGPENKAKVTEELKEKMKLRFHLDSSMEMIGMLLFGPQKGPSTLGSSRLPGSPVVDDWECLKSMVRVFEDHCGSLTQYGLKHMRGFANICNNGVSKSAMEEACIFACNGYDSGVTHPSVIGYSA